MASKHEYIGVPASGVGIHKEESDPRRHKARCIYNNEKICKCTASPYFGYKCGGSSHCARYMEASIDAGDLETIGGSGTSAKDTRTGRSQCDNCTKRTGKMCKIHSRRIPFEVESNKIECPYRCTVR